VNIYNNRKHLQYITFKHGDNIPLNV